MQKLTENIINFLIMSTKNKIENTVSINKFMGVVSEYETTDPLFTITYCYHSDWNRLMNVIKKIYETDEYYNQYILYNSSLISDGKIKITASIDKDYEQVLNFVKWHNKEQAQDSN